MSSNDISEWLIDLDHDLPTTSADREALRRTSHEVASWLDLDPADLERLLPPEALDRRPTARDAWTPFSLG
jgi:hypothetical protein